MGILENLIGSDSFEILASHARLMSLLMLLKMPLNSRLKRLGMFLA